jgi:hypothetical protein
MWWNKLCIIGLVLLTGNLLKAQPKTGEQWYVGFGKQKLSFQDDKVQNSKFFPTASEFYYLQHGNSNVCDTNGILHLATSTFVLMNGSTEGFIEGGAQTNNDSFTRYEGGTTPYSNTSIILPMGDNKFYVFITTMSDQKAYEYYQVGGVFYDFDEIRYSVVDMNANEGRGKVLESRKLLYKANGIPWLNKSNFTATRHANGRDWWLIKPSARDRYKRYVFLLTPTGIEKREEDLPKITSNIVYDNKGQSCFSHDGTLYAESNTNCPTTIWNFDRCTGQFTLKRIIDIQQHNKDTLIQIPQATGICFSPNNKYLYQNEFFVSYQIDLEEPNDYKALHCLNNYDVNNNLCWNNTLMQTPTGQIYIGHYHGICPTVSAIMEPNAFGDACKFNYTYAFIGYTLANGVIAGTASPPNMVNYGLGALVGSPCDTIKKNVSAHSAWAIYPNPVVDVLNVNVPEDGAQSVQIAMYNMLGQKVQQQSYALNYTYSFQHGIGSLASGLYYARCVTNTGQTYNQKIIKR